MVEMFFGSKEVRNLHIMNQWELRIPKAFRIIGTSACFQFNLRSGISANYICKIFNQSLNVQKYLFFFCEETLPNFIYHVLRLFMYLCIIYVFMHDSSHAKFSLPVLRYLDQIYTNHLIWGGDANYYNSRTQPFILLFIGSP